MKIYMKACEQEPDQNGVRRTMCVVVRDTYKELKATTFRSLKDWFPPGQWGVWRSTENIYYLGGIATANGVEPGAIVLEDGTSVFCEIMFLALDTPDDEDRLLSLEPTFAYVNEYRTIDIKLIQALIGRVGRFPAKPTWWGVFMDSNPPEIGSPHYKLFEEFDAEYAQSLADEHGLEKAPSVALYRQPSGRSAEAENIEFLPGGKGYYINMLAVAKAEGRDEGWIAAHVDGEYAYYSDSEGLYSKQFSSEMHVSKSRLEPDTSEAVLIGMDPGFEAAATFMQRDKYARWRVFAEVCKSNVDAEQFEQALKETIKEYGWENLRFLIVGDPFIKNRSSADRSASWENVFKKHGWAVMTGKHQGLTPRIGAVRAAMNRSNGGAPSFMIDPHRCPVLKRACIGAYHRAKVKGKDQHRDQPEKTEESHVAEAIQYPMSTFDWDMLNGGSMKSIPTTKAKFFSEIAKGRRAPVQQVNSGDWSPFA
jgi:hypothetical protein